MGNFLMGYSLGPSGFSHTDSSRNWRYFNPKLRISEPQF